MPSLFSDMTWNITSTQYRHPCLHDLMEGNGFVVVPDEELEKYGLHSRHYSPEIRPQKHPHKKRHYGVISKEEKGKLGGLRTWHLHSATGTVGYLKEQASFKNAFNEYLSSRLAQQFGLWCPQVDIVQFSYVGHRGMSSFASFSPLMVLAPQTLWGFIEQHVSIETEASEKPLTQAIIQVEREFSKLIPFWCFAAIGDPGAANTIVAMESIGKSDKSCMYPIDFEYANFHALKKYFPWDVICDGLNIDLPALKQTIETIEAVTSQSFDLILEDAFDYLHIPSKGKKGVRSFNALKKEMLSRQKHIREFVRSVDARGPDGHRHLLGGVEL